MAQILYEDDWFYLYEQQREEIKQAQFMLNGILDRLGKYANPDLLLDLCLVGTYLDTISKNNINIATRVLRHGNPNFTEEE